MATPEDQPPVSRGDGRAEGGTGTTTKAEEVTDTARHELARVSGEVRDQTVHLAEDLRDQLHDQARTQTDQLGDSAHRLSDQMHALAEGRPEEAGRLPERTERMADQIGQIAHEIETRGFDGLVEEVQDYARRRPGAFLLGAAVAGFAVSRLTRGERDREQQGGQAGGEARHDRGNGQAAPGGEVPWAAGDPAVQPPRTAGRPPGDEPPYPPMPPTPGSGPGPEVRP